MLNDISKSAQLTIIFYYPFINPIANPADILPVNGIPKLVITIGEAVAVVLKLPVLPVTTGIGRIAFESVVIVPSDTV
jgi:hypothetical protein